MKKIFAVFTIIVFAFFITSDAQAIRLAPGEQPLQLVPDNVQPNLSGNVQNGEGVDRADNLGVPEYTEVETENRGENISNSSLTDVSSQPVTTPGFSWWLMGIVILISAIISGLYYWYKTRVQ